jgi:hypothetical protein
VKGTKSPVVLSLAYTEAEYGIVAKTCIHRREALRFARIVEQHRKVTKC